MSLPGYWIRVLGIAATKRPELEPLARLPADNPNPVMRIALDGEVLYANPPSQVLLARIAADPDATWRWREVCAALRASNAPAEAKARFDLGKDAYLLRAVIASDSDCLQVYAVDVSELVAQERRLSDSEAKLALAIRTARIGLFEIDVPDRAIVCNDIYSWQVGLGPVETREALSFWAERLHPDDRDRINSALESFMAGRVGHYRVEHRLSDGRGNWIWVTAIAEVVEIDAAGMPKRIVGSHLDVTELKQTESALDRRNRTSQAKLNLVNLGDSATEADVLTRAADHAAKLCNSDFGVMHLLRADDGSVDASHPSQHTDGSGQPPFTFRRAVEIREADRAVAIVEVAGKATDYTAEDELTLQLLGTEAWHVVRRMRQSHKLEIQSRVLECAIDAIVIADSKGVLEWANPAFEKATGYALAEVVGLGLNFLRSGEHDEAFFKRLWETISAGRSFSGEFINRRKDGSLVTMLQTITPVVGEGGRIEKYIAISEDVTQRKSAEDRLVFLARHDELTGLLNRASLVDAIDQAIAESDRTGKGFTVLYLGLDHFKAVNDRLGRRAGDAVLQRVAAILSDGLRPTDVVARSGSDEFAVLQRYARGPDDAAVLARRLASALAAASEESTDTARLGASIGISAFPSDPGSADDLLRNAELAMRRAKAETRGSVRYFTPALHEAAVTSATLAADLPAAIRENQVFLMYQPIVDLQTARIVGCEALARWRHPTLGLIPPNQFIAVAEETGIIRELGLYILKRALAEFGVAFPDPVSSDVTLSVNLSFGQFSEDDFVDVIRAELARAGFPATHLEMELTESMLALEPERAIKTTRSVSELGCKLAIDDFGTGYSSLAQLRRFRVDFLKIDRSFVVDLANGEGPQAVVRAAISMAHSLGMAIIAEGIETPEQAEFLRGEGAELGQGYLFARPLPIEELAAMWQAGPLAVLSHAAASKLTTRGARYSRPTHSGSAKIH